MAPSILDLEIVRDDSCKPDPASENAWLPDPVEYRARACRRRFKVGSVALPAGFPAQITSPLVWSGTDLSEDEYLMQLSTENIIELEQALAYFKGLNLPISSLNRITFPLPKLGPYVISLSSKLYGGDNGRGFFILRGLDPKRYDSKENVIIYVGLSSYVAEKRGRQDENNNHLLHLTDLGSNVAPDDVRQSPYSNVAQPFHTDTGDIIGLYTLSPAYRGGRSVLASSWKVYNVLASHRPDHIHTLSKGNWVFDTFGRASGPAFLTRSLLHLVDKDNNSKSKSTLNPRVLLSFSRRPLTGSRVSPRTPGIPRLSIAQADALDTVHFSASAHSLAVSQQAGDLQFWNNLVLLHAREGFQDGSEGEKRHLLRLWLKDPTRSVEWGGLPESLHPMWDEAYGDNGFGGNGNWPIEPIRSYGFVTEQTRSCGHA